MDYNNDLMNNYRKKPSNATVYWIILSVHFVYFLITYFYQYIFGNILISYLEIDPITVSIILGAFLALSKPIGGLVFGVAFWKISRIMSYERNIMTYMIISGFGIFLIFAANQAATQTVPGIYPPFGLSNNCFEYSSIFHVVRYLQFSNTCFSKSQPA